MREIARLGSWGRYFEMLPGLMLTLATPRKILRISAYGAKKKGSIFRSLLLGKTYLRTVWTTHLICNGNGIKRVLRDWLVVLGFLGYG